MGGRGVRAARGFARLAPPDRPELYLLALTLTALAALGAARAPILQLCPTANGCEMTRIGGPQLQDRARGGTAGAGAGAGQGGRGMVLLVPWVWVGALGGPLESVLAVAAAAALGRARRRRSSRRSCSFGWLTRPGLSRSHPPQLQDRHPGGGRHQVGVGSGRSGWALVPLAGATGETGGASPSPNWPWSRPSGSPWPCWDGAPASWWRSPSRSAGVRRPGGDHPVLGPETSRSGR